MANQILVFGVGRSGTTTIYNVLQEILSNAYPEDVDFVYEPFLWNRGVFNKKYVDIKTEFSYNASLSFDGICADRDTPLFVDENEVDQYIDHAYLRSLVSPSEGKNNILTKFVRANGRLPLFKKLAPNAKIIFVIRNPLDVVNSVINMFSFFGDDFLPSDLKRFKKEVKNLKKYNDDLAFDSAEKQAFAYWFYMNRHFIDCMHADSINIMPIVYEDYVSNREYHIQKICDFLNVNYKERYSESSRTKVGRISKNPHLTCDGYTYIKSKMYLYSEMVSNLGVDFDPARIYAKYDKHQLADRVGTPYDGRNALWLKAQIAAKERAIEGVISIVSERDSAIAERDAALEKKWKEVAELMALVKYKQGQIEERDSAIAERDAALEKKWKEVAELMALVKLQRGLLEKHEGLLLTLEGMIQINPGFHLVAKVRAYKKLVAMFIELRNGKSKGGE